MSLKIHVATRMLLAIPMLFIVLTSLFVVLHVLPGDPVLALYGEKASPEYMDEIRHRLGLDKPLLDQYINYMSNLFHGDLGISLTSSKTVTFEISRTWPVTLQYCILTALFVIIIGLLLGIVSALKKDRIHDQIIRIFSLLAFSLPIFWLGLLLQFVFSLKLNWFPLDGLHTLGMEVPADITGIVLLDSLLKGNIKAFIDVLHHLILPAITLCVQYIAVTCRVSRANIIETLNEDYINTARAKGLRESVILFKHALRNALLPVITIWGWAFAGLLGGSVILETIFGLPGMGNLLYASIAYRDYAVIQGVLTFFAIITIAMSIIIDITYSILDPRIRYT